MYEGTSVNAHGVNRVIEYHALDESAMKAAGFRKTDLGTWFYDKSLLPKYQISFIVSFPCEGGTQDDLRIDVLDEEFGQPYDYQRMIGRGSKNPVAHQVADLVETEMEHLQSAGILSGHVRGAYV